MSTLYLDEQKIETLIIPNIQIAIDNLQAAVNVGYLDVPYDFGYWNYLNTLQSKNDEILKLLKAKKKAYEDIIKRYKSIENQNLTNFCEIKILNVPVRGKLKK